MRLPPFAQMAPVHVEQLLAVATQAYYAPEEPVLSPMDGTPQNLYLVRQGRIIGRRLNDPANADFVIDAGDLFPVGALMAGRPVTATYQTTADTFCLLLPAAAVQAVAALSAPFADYLNARMQQLLDLSRAALQSQYASQALTEQSLETPLEKLLRGPPEAVAPATPLGQVLALMHKRRIGSMLVTDDAGAVCGILTQHDILGRVALPQLPLTTPISKVMSTPVRTLDCRATAHEAALLMSRHNMRHVPVTQDGRLVGIVSERDLFSMQRLSIKQVSAALRRAGDVAALRGAAQDIRKLAARLLGQGIGARQLTELISHLNDLLTERLVELSAAQHGLDLQGACWLAFGSEGRSEQTIATDQDNGLIFESDDPDRDRPAWLAFALDVNQGLAACGYPLCKGNVMASNPACCLTPHEWRARFEQWIEHGAPNDLLNASIYFDLRPIAGRTELAQALRELISSNATQVPRFIKQMADNALRNQAPLDWLGAIATRTLDGRELLDLKLQGSAIFVDVARIYALALGVDETNTRRRLEAIGAALKAPERESEGWCSAFEFLQMLRLRVQLRASGKADEDQGMSNYLEPAALNDVDQRVLKECFRVLRRLQQRMSLDYQR
jgi:CBS domain-containing protein